MEKDEIFKSIQKYCFPKTEYQEVQGDDGEVVRIDVHDNDENYNKCDNGSGNNNSSNISNNNTIIGNGSGPNNIINHIARSEERSCRIIENENAQRSHHSTSAMLTSANRDHLNYHHHLHHHNHNKSIVHSEKFKAALSFLLLVVSFFFALISLALTHDRLPDRKVYQPLPDAILDGVSSLDFLLNVAEIQIIVIVNVCILLVFFHKHRFVIAKRCFFLLSILYFYRSITMYVTVLPISSTTYYCSPKSNSTSTYEIIKRAFTLLSGMGLSINNKQIFCGDSIFSGHTTILFFGYLVLNQYSPKKIRLYLSVLALVNAIAGVIFILLSHMHYTIDVIIAYYVTTRLFWSYHSTLNCSNPSSSSSLSPANSPIRHEWFWPLFKYLESDTIAASRGFSNDFDWPWKK